MVQGDCIFGGFLIVSVMDLIVASEDAEFLPAHLQLFTAPWDLGIRKSKGGFQSVDELVAVKGLGEAMLERLRPHVTLKGKTTARRL